MAYYDNSPRGYNQGGYSKPRQNYNQGYRPQWQNDGNSYQNRGGGGYNNQRPQKKKSMCRISTVGKGANKGEQIITAWNVSKDRGLVSITISPYKNTRQHETEKGRIWENWYAKVTFTRTGQVHKMSALVDPNTKKATIKDLGWVCNPAKNFCGSYLRKNR